MPRIIPSVVITLDGSGGEFAGLLDVNSPTEVYYITGSATATSNYSIFPTGTPQADTTFIFKYSGNLDITTNSVTFNIFGTSITQLQLTKHLTITCFFNGTSWTNTVDLDFSQSNIISSTNLGTAITGSNIAANSLNLHTVSQALSLTNDEIAANTINGHQKLVAGSVTDTELATGISGSKLTAHTVANAAISTGTASALKITDSSGNMQDLALGANILPIGTGTSISTITLSQIQSSTGTWETYSFDKSFESGEQAITSIYFPFGFKIVNILITVTKAIAGTDDGLIHISDDVTRTTISDITVPASTVINTQIPTLNLNYSYHPYGGSGTSTSTITISASKTTAGGKVFISINGERT